jgi:hypothetical protein
MNRISNFSEFNGLSNLGENSISAILENKSLKDAKDLKRDYDSSYKFISDIYVTILLNSILSFIQKLTEEAESNLDPDGVKKLSDCAQSMIDAYDDCIKSPLDSKFTPLKNNFLNSSLPASVPARNPKIKYLSGSVISEYKKIVDYFPRIIEIYSQDKQDLIQLGLNQDIDSILNSLTKTNESVVAGGQIFEKKAYQRDKYYGLIEELYKRYSSLKNSIEKEIKERSMLQDREDKVLVSELRELLLSLKDYEDEMDVSQIGVQWRMSGKKIREKSNKISDFFDSVLTDLTDLLLSKINLTSIMQSLVVKIESSLNKIDNLLEEISTETKEVTAADVSAPAEPKK